MWMQQRWATSEPRHDLDENNPSEQQIVTYIQEWLLAAV